jgi:hypothetical protein
MNWLRRARLELPRNAHRTTANTAKRTLTAVTAVRGQKIRRCMSGNAYLIWTTMTGGAALIART